MEREITQVFLAEDEMQAGMVIAAFEEAGIPVLKKTRGSDGLSMIYGFRPILGIELYTAKEDEERAVEILLGLGLLNESEEKSGKLPLVSI
ncbi:MAG: DUF2007 domain-containing protein [Eubacteriales bacterium]|nr:DUF2007 domain-containing protein [Eubacteriales bacterium]